MDNPVILTNKLAFEILNPCTTLPSQGEIDLLVIFISSCNKNLKQKRSVVHKAFP